MTVGLALLTVSILLFSFSEIRSFTRIKLQQGAFHALNADLVKTMIVLQHEQLGVLGRRIASDNQVDVATTNDAADLEVVLDLLRADRVLGLVVTTADGSMLARSAAQSVNLDERLFSEFETGAQETRLLTDADGDPVMRHRVPIRRGDQIIGAVWIILPVAVVTRDFFPDLAGLAFRFPDGTLKPLYGSRIDVSQQVNSDVSILGGMDSQNRFEAVFVPLKFGAAEPIGDLVLLREVTNLLQREELLSRLTLVALLVIILIAIGFLTRALRVGFRPLGAIVYLLDRMSKGETGLQFAYPSPSKSLVSDEDANPQISNREDTTKAPRLYREIDTLLRSVDSFRASVEAQNELIVVHEQLNNARRIQQSLLPQSFESDARLDIFGRMRPALEVAGDFFDIFRLDDDRIAIVIADVSGKGPASAIFAAQAATLLRALCHQTHDPSAAVRLANKSLSERNPENMFLTGIVAFLTMDTGDLTFVNAGHCAPVIMRRTGTVEQIATEPDFVLGVVADLEWTTHNVKLAMGDRCLLYSDGLDEAQAKSGEMLGTERVLEIYAALTLGKDIASRKVVEGLFDDIDAFSAGAPQADDITAITFRCLDDDRDSV